MKSHRHRFLHWVGLWLGSALLCGGALAVPKLGSGPDAFRQLVRCPQVDLQIAFGVDLSRGFVVNDPERPRTEIAAARAVLKMSPDNAHEWLRLGTWLPATGDTNGTAAALSKAIGLYQTRVERTPSDDEAQAELAEALKLAGRGAEAERRLRAALEANPSAWRSRLALAQILDAQWLTGSSSAKAEKPAKQAEAGKLVDRAVELAPNEPTVYRARGFHRFAVAQDGLAESAPSGKREPGSVAAQAAVEDYWRSATLWKTNVLSWGIAGFTELVARVGPEASEGVEFGTLPADSQQRLVGALRTLESLASEDAGPTAAMALEMRGILQFLTGSRSASEVTLKRAVKLDPSRFQAWEVLLAVHLRSEDRDGLRETCAARAKVRPNGRNFLMYAKSLERAGRLDDALETAEAGVEAEPENLWLRMTVVSLKLKTSTDAASLEGVADQLREIATRIDRQPKNQEWIRMARHFVPTVCLFQALSGNLEEARRMLGEWMKNNPTDAWAREISEALGT